jgi:hypothetical protein
MGHQPLAYVFWHWPRAGTDGGRYERVLAAFHTGLRETPPPGFQGSATLRVAGVPWAATGAPSYEDWYVLDGFAALATLNDAAVSERAGHKARHDRAAATAAGGTAGLYRLHAGHPALRARTACWFAKPAGMAYAELDRLLGPVWEPAPPRPVGLWQRQLVLGPGAEFCLLATEPVALPSDLEVLVVDRQPLAAAAPRPR